MAHEIRDTFFCDICGHSFPEDRIDSHGAYRYMQVINHPATPRIGWTLPCGWNFIQGKYVCNRHRISVDYQRDSITLKEPTIND